jgi:hypothetical protein
MYGEAICTPAPGMWNYIKLIWIMEPDRKISAVQTILISFQLFAVMEHLYIAFLGASSNWNFEWTEETEEEYTHLF